MTKAHDKNGIIEPLSHLVLEKLVVNPTYLVIFKFASFVFFPGIFLHLGATSSGKRS